MFKCLPHLKPPIQGHVNFFDRMNVGGDFEEQQ